MCPGSSRSIAAAICSALASPAGCTSSASGNPSRSPRRNVATTRPSASASGSRVAVVRLS